MDYYYSLNIVGSEWIIIIFVALVLILGTNQLPNAARKFGRAVNEYNKAKNEVQTQMKDFSNHNIDVNGPVQNERQKLEAIANSLGIDPVGKPTEELSSIISSKIGRQVKTPKRESEGNEMKEVGTKNKTEEKEEEEVERRDKVEKKRSD